LINVVNNFAIAYLETIVYTGTLSISPFARRVVKSATPFYASLSCFFAMTARVRSDNDVTLASKSSSISLYCVLSATSDSFFKFKIPDTGGFATLFTTAAGVPGLHEVPYSGYSSQRSRIDLRVLDEKPNSQTGCDNGEEYATGDWTKGRVSIAILEEKERMKENAKMIRALWRKCKGLISILA